jgi:hypothetical protein
MSDAHRRALLFIVPAVVTFTVLRAYLWFAPDTDLNVGAYNIHHLYSGLVVATIGGVPLGVLHPDANRRLVDLSRVVFSVGLAMALDEWLYLIATDGTNASYSLPVSFWGGLAAVALACAYAVVLATIDHRRRTN